MKKRLGRIKSLRVLFVVTVVVLAAVTAGIVISRREDVHEFPCTPEQIADINALSRKFDGVLVYQREKEGRSPRICKTVIGETTFTVLTKNGYYPRWSPDGRKIAFLRENKVMIMTSSGRWQRRLTEVKDPWAICYHSNGKEVLFTDGDEIKSVAIKTRKVRKVVDGHEFRVLDISEDDARLAASAKGHKLVLYDFAISKTPVIKKGCSVSLSPDADLFARNSGDHSQLFIWSWQTREIVRTMKAPHGTTIDNGFWSNHRDWLVTRTEGLHNEDIFVYHEPSGTPTRVTFCGDCNRPDLFVGAVAH